MRTIARPLNQRYHRWHPWGHGSPTGLQRGGSVQLAAMYGPSGLVGPVGSTDHPYVGMDPSDPVTWVRPYNPAPGMISYLNFDGAQPNQTQTTGGRQLVPGGQDGDVGLA